MRKDDKNGAILVVILAIAAGAGLMMTAISKLGITERRLNERSRVVLEAKNAAEAVVEDGFSQLVERFQKQNSFSINALSPQGGSPLVISDAFYELFLSGSGRTVSGIVLAPAPYDPTVEWGKQDTEIIGGIVPPGEWKFIDSRIPGNEFDPLKDKYVFIREVALYGKAAVLNSEGNPYTSYVGQSLQVRDAPLFAHAIFYNMDMEIAPGPTMDIRGAVHANGEMFIQANDALNFYYNVSAVGRIYHGPNPIITKAGAGGDVTFSNGMGYQLSMKVGGSWLDSRNSDFRSLSSNRWNGNVQGFEHGIQFHNPVAVEPYVRDNPKTATVDDPLNYAYQLIQPLENLNDTGYNSEVESQKFAYKAGMVIEIDADDGTYDAYVLARTATGTPQYDASGNPVKEELKLNSSIIKIQEYHASSSNVSKGLYDKRMRQGINIVEINVGMLKHHVEKNSDKDWGNHHHQTPSLWWNGIVYIEFPTDGTSGRPDGVKPAVSQWAVKLVDGEEIPNPEFAWPRDIYGMTLATNAPLYVHGNYNADGLSNTGSANDSDYSNLSASEQVKKEPPAALAADAVTILSNNWVDKDSIKTISSSVRTTTSFTEVSAAILTGLVPSDKKGMNNYSGGVENFPRFLETWNTTLRYRGSMVALFESEVADEPWGKSDVYSPPTRNWGFHSLFSQGFYPPGTPNTRTFRRVNYRSLSAEEYYEGIEELKQQLGI